MFFESEIYLGKVSDEPGIFLRVRSMDKVTLEKVTKRNKQPNKRTKDAIWSDVISRIRCALF